MLIDTAIDVRVLPTALARFTAIVGLGRWKKCVDDLSKWQNRTQLFDDYLEQRHGVELAFERVAQRRRLTGRLIWPPKDISTIRYYNLALSATAVYDRLSVRGKKKLAGMIASALQSEFGFGPLAFEMQIVTHLMGRGFDVQFNDIEGDGGFDFLATRNGTQVEVECKHVSGDIGRKIHKKRQLVLGEHLLPRLDETIKQLGCGILVEVEMLDKLTGRLDHLEKITRLVISAISSGKETGQVCDVSARKVPFDAQHPAFAKGRNVEIQDIARLFGMDPDFGNRHVIINIAPGRAVACVLLQSRKPDTVLPTIIKKLTADAKKQFTHDRAALLCVHMSDLTSEQLLDIHNDGANGVFRQQITGMMDRRPWLHTVALTATGGIHVERGDLNGPILALGLRDASMLCRSSAHPDADNNEIAHIFDAAD
jgi:hypothetical protein